MKFTVEALMTYMYNNLNLKKKRTTADESTRVEIPWKFSWGWKWWAGPGQIHCPLECARQRERETQSGEESGHLTPSERGGRKGRGRGREGRKQEGERSWRYIHVAFTCIYLFTNREAYTRGGSPQRKRNPVKWCSSKRSSMVRILSTTSKLPLVSVIKVKHIFI